MTIACTRMQSELQVLPKGGHTLNGSAQNLHVHNYTTYGFFKSIMLVIANASLSGDVTVLARGNTAADGSGTDTTIATMTLPSASDQLVLELDSEQISYLEDQTGGTGTWKSLVFEVTGTNADTLDAVVVAEPLHQEMGKTPSDVTAVTFA